MKNFVNGTMLGLALIAACGAKRAYAEPASAARAQARIVAGEKSGKLTQLEAHYLREQQRTIRAQRQQFMADGEISPIERRVLKRDKRQANRSIRREMRDNDRR